MIGSITKYIKQKKSWLTEIASLHGKALLHGRALQIKQNNIKNIKPDDIILFAVMKNEAHRLKYFIDYYRKLGVGHFIFVDNGSTDHFNEVVSEQNDITSFYTDASYKDSNFGMYWANYLLLKYGCGHWCLTCDPDEFLTYPYMESRDLIDLTQYLSSVNESSFFTTMVDMYSKDAVENSHYAEGSDPLLVCPYFDAIGYSKKYNKYYRNTFIQGGVRQRIFYPDFPEKAPALNKVPLVKWESHFAYVSSMHMAVPRRLNQTCNIQKTTGALLHYKFISQLSEKILEEEIAQQHYDNSSEYKKYNAAINNKTILYDPSVSVRFHDWKTLARLGLINKGEW